MKTKLSNKLLNFDFVLIHIFFQGSKLFLTKNTCDLVQSSAFKEHEFFPVSLLDKKILSAGLDITEEIKYNAFGFFPTMVIYKSIDDLFKTIGYFPSQPTVHTKKIWLWCFHEIVTDNIKTETFIKIEAKNLYKYLVNWMIDNFMPMDIRLLLAEEFKTIQPRSVCQPADGWEVRLFDLNDERIQCPKCHQGLFVKHNNIFVCTSCNIGTIGVGIKWQKI